MLVITSRRLIFLDPSKHRLNTERIGDGNVMQNDNFKDIERFLKANPNVNEFYDMFNLCEIRNVIFPLLSTIEKKMPVRFATKFEVMKVKNSQKENASFMMRLFSKEDWQLVRDIMSNCLSKDVKKPVDFEYSIETKLQLSILANTSYLSKLYEELVIEKKCIKHEDFFRDQEEIIKLNHQKVVNSQEAPLQNEFYKFKKEKNMDNEDVIIMKKEDKEKLFSNFPGLQKEYESLHLKNFKDRKQDEAKFWDDFWKNQQSIGSFLVGTSVDGSKVNCELPKILNEVTNDKVVEDCNIKNKNAIEFDNELCEKYRIKIVDDEVELNNQNKLDLLKSINNNSTNMFRTNVMENQTGNFDSIVDKYVNVRSRNPLGEVEEIGNDLDSIGMPQKNETKRSDKMDLEDLSGKKNRINKDHNKSLTKPNSQANDQDQKFNNWKHFIKERKDINNVLNEYSENLKTNIPDLASELTINKTSIDHLYNISSQAHKNLRHQLVVESDNFADRQLVSNKEYPEKLNAQIIFFSAKAYETIKFQYSLNPIDNGNHEAKQKVASLLEVLRQIKTDIKNNTEIKHFLNDVNIDEKQREKYKKTFQRLDTTIDHTYNKFIPQKKPVNSNPQHQENMSRQAMPHQSNNQNNNIRHQQPDTQGSKRPMHLKF